MPLHLNTLLLLFAGGWGQAPQSGAGSWGPSSSQAPPKPVSDAALTAKRAGQSARCKFKIVSLPLVTCVPEDLISKLLAEGQVVAPKSSGPGQTGAVQREAGWRCDCWACAV